MSRQEGQLLLRSAGDLIAKFVQERGGVEPINQLREAVRSRTEGGEYYAVAVAAETEIIDPQTGRQTRAARVEVEHQAMTPVTWFWPFEQSGDGWQFGGGSGEGYMEEG